MLLLTEENTVIRLNCQTAKIVQSITPFDAKEDYISQAIVLKGTDKMLVTSKIGHQYKL